MGMSKSAWMGLILIIGCIIVLIASCGFLLTICCYLSASMPDYSDGSHVSANRNANGTYTTNLVNDRLGLKLSITGQHDLSRDLRASPVYAEYYSNISSRETPLLTFRTDTSFDSARVTITYNATEIKDPERMAIFYYNETYGLYLPLDTTVNTIDHTATARLPEACMFAGFDAPGMEEHYRKIAEFNAPLAQYMKPTVVVTVKGDINVTVIKQGPYWSTVTETRSYHVI